MKGKREPGGLTPFVQEMVEGMEEMIADLEAGAPPSKYTVRTVKLDITPGVYGPEELKAVRAKFNASQALFAKFLGVAPDTLRGWEHGLKPVPAIASRFLDEIQAFPEMWTRRILAAK